MSRRPMTMVGLLSSLLIALLGRPVVAHACAVCDVTLNATANPDLQAEIDKLAAGKVLCLEAGVWKPAATVVLSKPITIQGAQCGVDPQPRHATSRTPGSGSESIVDGGKNATPLGILLRISADDVTLDGIEVRHGTGDLIESLQAAPPKLRPAIRNCIVHDSAGPGDEAMQLRNSQDAVLERNFAYDVTGDALNLCCDSTRGTIQCNEVRDAGTDNAAIYVYESDSSHAPFVIGVTIADNLIDNTAGVGGKMKAGIKLGTRGTTKDQADTGGSILRNIVKAPNQTGILIGTSNTSIAGNQITGVAGSPAGEDLHGGIVVGSTSTSAAVAHDITIRDNVVERCGPSSVSTRPTAAIRVGTSIAATQPVKVTVNGNSMSRNEQGVYYWNFGLATDTLDARSNWWGDASGPRGTPAPSCGPLTGGDTVTCNVTTSPVLASAPGTAGPLPCTISLLSSACAMADLKANAQAYCGQGLVYSWSVAPTCGSLSSSSSAQTTFALNPPCTGSCTVNLTVTDTSTPPLRGSCSLVVTPPPDNTPPTLTPGSIASCYTVSAAAEAAALAATTVSDNCPGAITRKAATVGACAATVTVTASDRCGNAASVNYSTRIDNTPPTLQGVPVDVTVECDSVPAPAVPTATDNCDSKPVITFTELRKNGACEDSYILVRNWRATDSCGNASSRTHLVTVVDTTSPEPRALLTPVAPRWPLSPRSPLSPHSVCTPPLLRTFVVGFSATDNCDPAPATRAFVRVVNHDVAAKGAPCRERVEDFPVVLGEVVDLRPVAPPCPLRPPKAPVQAMSVDSRGRKVFHGESIVLMTTADDRCGNTATVTFDPVVEPSVLCDDVIIDKTCCPALGLPAAANCNVPVCARLKGVTAATRTRSPVALTR